MRRCYAALPFVCRRAAVRVPAGPSGGRRAFWEDGAHFLFRSAMPLRFSRSRSWKPFGFADRCRIKEAVHNGDKHLATRTSKTRIERHDPRRHTRSRPWRGRPQQRVAGAGDTGQGRGVAARSSESWAPATPARVVGSVRCHPMSRALCHQRSMRGPLPASTQRRSRSSSPCGRASTAAADTRCCAPSKDGASGRSGTASSSCASPPDKGAC